MARRQVPGLALGKQVTAVSALQSLAPADGGPVQPLSSSARITHWSEPLNSTVTSAQTLDCSISQPGHGPTPRSVRFEVKENSATDAQTSTQPNVQLHAAPVAGRSVHAAVQLEVLQPDYLQCNHAVSNMQAAPDHGSADQHAHAATDLACLTRQGSASPPAVALPVPAFSSQSEFQTWWQTRAAEIQAKFAAVDAC